MRNPPTATPLALSSPASLLTSVVLPARGGSADPYVRRFYLSLLAPADVVEDAVALFRRVRDIRDLLISGAGAETAEYRAAQRAYYDAIKAMSDTMRKDLGSSPLGAATMGGPAAEADEPPS